jgi:hypothetical protein
VKNLSDYFNSVPGSDAEKKNIEELFKLCWLDGTQKASRLRISKQEGRS